MHIRMSVCVCTCTYTYIYTLIHKGLNLLYADGIAVNERMVKSFKLGSYFDSFHLRRYSDLALDL